MSRAVLLAAVLCAACAQHVGNINDNIGMKPTGPQPARNKCVGQFADNWFVLAVVAEKNVELRIGHAFAAMRVPDCPAHSFAERQAYE